MTADVHPIGTVADFDGATLPVGADHDLITVGTWRLDRSQRDDLMRLLSEAERQADAHDCPGCQDNRQAADRPRRYLVWANLFDGTRLERTCDGPAEAAAALADYRTGRETAPFVFGSGIRELAATP